MSTTIEPSGDRHDESAAQRLDRNTIELLNELRIAGAGIQVMFAFLLVVPFNSGFGRVSSFDRYDYFVTLLCIATATALLITPSIHHRLLFRQAQKSYIVRVGNRMAIAAMGFLAVGLTGVLVLISDVVFGGTTAVIVGGVSAVSVGVLWFGVPIRRARCPGARRAG